MKGSEIKLVKYMSGDDKRFVIPVYQRNYNWKTEHDEYPYSLTEKGKKEWEKLQGKNT